MAEGEGSGTGFPNVIVRFTVVSVQLPIFCIDYFNESETENSSIFVLYTSFLNDLEVMMRQMFPVSSISGI